MNKIKLILGASILIFGSIANAATISLTGLQLFNDPDVSFYRTTPRLDGDSIVFDERRSDRWEKLFDLPILLNGEAPPNSLSAEISISINLTRLTVDFDPYFTLTDGNFHTGVVVSDNQFLPDLRGGTSWLYDFIDTGDTVAQIPIAPKVIVADAGMPGVGESFDVTLKFILEDDITKIEVDFLEGVGQPFRSSSLVLDRNSALSFAMLGENISEQYQLNSLAINTIFLFRPIANGANINFEFFDDPLDLTPVIRGTHLPGTVSGSLFGFSDNLNDQIPTSMSITSDTSGLGMTGNEYSNFMDVTGEGFDIQNGVVTDVSLFFNFIDPGAGRMQIRFNYRDFENIIMWNGGTGPIAEIGNGDGFGGAAYTVSAASVPVTIDIKPGSDPNSINLRSQGVIPVAILSTNIADGDAIDFDATQVDALTVKFGPSGAVESHGQGHVEDVDGDGDPDMVLHFKTQETGIVCGSGDATLVGETMGGTQFTGTDTVRTDGCNGSTKGKGALSWIFLLGLSVLGLWRQRG